MNDNVDMTAQNCSRYHTTTNHNFLLQQSVCSQYTRIVVEEVGNLNALWNSFKKILQVFEYFARLYTISIDLTKTLGHFLCEKIVEIRLAIQSSSLIPVTRPSPLQTLLLH